MRFDRITICLLLLSAFAPKVGGQSAEALALDDRRKLAEAMISRGMYETALPEFELLAETTPAPADLDLILLRLGEAQMRVGKRDAAQTTFTRLMATFPQSPHIAKAMLFRGKLLLDAGKSEVAAAMLEALIGKHPEAALEVEAIAAAAEANKAAGNAEKAVAHYETLQKREPNTVIAANAALEIAILRNDAKAFDELIAKPFNARVGAEALYRRGLIAYNAEDFNLAAANFRLLAERYPGDVRAADSLAPSAWANFKAGRHADAAVVAKKALEKSPAAEWLFLLASAKSALLDYAGAVEAFDRMIADFPRDERINTAKFARLDCLFRLKRYADLLKDADSFAPPEELRAGVLFLQGKSAEALADRNRAVQFYRMLASRYPSAPLATEANFRVATLLEAAKDWNEAAKYYAAAANGDFAPSALFKQGWCLSQASQNDAALAVWRKLRVDYPKHEIIAETLYFKAITEMRSGAEQAAEETFSEFLREYPKSPRAAEAHYWLAQLLYKRKEYKPAEDALRRALAETPPLDIQREATMLLGAALQAQGRDDDAAKLLQPLLSAPIRDKFSPDNLQWLAELQFKRKAFAESAQAAELLATNAPSAAWKQIGLTLVGRAMRSQEKNLEAIEAFRAAAAIDVKTSFAPEAALRLGELLLAQGDTLGARPALEQAVKLAASPEHEGTRVRAYYALGQCAEAADDKEGAVRYYLMLGLLHNDPVIVPGALERAAALFDTLGRKDEAEKVRAELKTNFPNRQVQ